MAINSDVRVHLAIEQLGKNNNGYQLSSNHPPQTITVWDATNSDAQPTDEEINAAWETWKSKNGSVAFVELRNQRNKKLRESDWMALPDRTMTDAQKTYRQALRDLPANQTPVDEKLSNITWPTEPT